MKRFFYSFVICALSSFPAFAESSSWDDIRHALYGDRALRDGASLISVGAPYRSQNDARTEISTLVHAPGDTLIKKVSVILDENPMPVSAVFELVEPAKSFFAEATMRINGPTPLHVVVETTDDQLWMMEEFVKTSGLGACSAAPGSDPEEALATLGQMTLIFQDGDQSSQITSLRAKLRSRVSDHVKLSVDVMHPSHSGMQMDQISLLYLPMRYVETLNVVVDGKPYLEITGSISLSENPKLTFGVPRVGQDYSVTLRDTDGYETTQRVLRAGY